MAPIEPAAPAPSGAAVRAEWNEAHARLELYLESFAMEDSFHVARLTLLLLDRAKAVYAQDPSRAPVTIALEEARYQMIDWLTKSIGEREKLPENLVATGTLALLLTDVPRRAPETFLLGDLSGELKKSMHEALVDTGPDLNVSSMTPRHLDYGPMLDLARQTWHRLDLRATLAAIAFWICLYFLLYEWLVRIV